MIYRVDCPTKRTFQICWVVIFWSLISNGKTPEAVVGWHMVHSALPSSLRRNISPRLIRFPHLLQQRECSDSTLPPLKLNNLFAVLPLLFSLVEMWTLHLRAVSSYFTHVGVFVYITTVHEILFKSHPLSFEERCYETTTHTKQTKPDI